MNRPPETRSSLIASIQTATNQDAWHDFVEIYEPFVYAQARRFGLQHADASEVVQGVFVAVSKAVRRFQQDESRGRFRTWLYAIGKNICLQQLEKVAKDRARQATSLNPAELVHKPSGEAILVEHRRRAFEWAADRIRDDFQERTWQAFWRTSVEGQPIESVAAELRLSVGAVYIARCRVMRRLRTEVQLITDDDGLENRSSGTQHSQPDVGKTDRVQGVEKLQVAKKEPGK